MARLRTALLLALAGTLPAPAAPADEAADAVAALQVLLGGVTGDLVEAAGRLAEEERTGASDAILRAALAGVALRERAEGTETREALGVDADRVARAAAALQRALEKADLWAAEAGRSDAAVLRAVKRASARGAKVEGALRRADTAGPVVVLEELRPRSAGFHRPGQVVAFRARVLPPGACPGSLVATVSDTAALLGKSSVLDPGLRTVGAGGTFTVTMGEDRGASRVELHGCGRSSVRLLYNYGRKPAGGGGGPGTETWDFSFTGSDEFVLGGFPWPTYMETWAVSIAFHGDLVASLGRSVPDPTGTGVWSGIELPLLQQPEPSIVRLLDFEDSVPVALEVWWSTTDPTLHVRSDFPLIAHRFRWTASGTEDSVPIFAVWLDLGARDASRLTGTWYAVGSGSMSGNSSSGTWTATKR